jgi:Cu/Ag efflux protein CusF
MTVRSNVPAALALGLLATCLAASAQTPPAGAAPPAATLESNMSVAPGSAVAKEVLKTSATIVAIDAASRSLTLKRQDGKVVDLVLPEAVRNFEQLKVGDKVQAEYSHAVALELKKGGGGSLGVTGAEGVKRSEPGQKPGGTATRQVIVLADVVNVDKKKNRVTLKGPAGNLMDLAVYDPEQLKNIKKGDQVQALYTESLAIKVDAAAK